MVIEIVGPAGVGKSAVAGALTRLDRTVRAGVWNLPRPLLARSAVASLVPLVAMWRDGAGGLGAVKQMVRLGALERLVTRLGAGRTRTVVLDEGPVFALSWLHVFADRRLADASVAAWRRRATAHWAGALAAVVWLDAPDPVLLARLRGRAKRDDVFSTMTDAEILDLQAAYRAAFARVIPAVTGTSGARLVLLDAEHATADGVAQSVAAALGDGRGD